MRIIIIIIIIITPSGRPFSRYIEGDGRLAGWPGWHAGCPQDIYMI